MPLYKSDHVEYRIESGHIEIAMEDGTKLPAYWAHPARGTRFPGVALIHNWWGMTDIIRRMAHLFAQTGFYVIIPDLFHGVQPKTHQEALQQVKQLGEGAFQAIDAALTVLETHHMCNAKVAAVGVGMGGTLAYQAAIERDDLEVAVAFYGFPQKLLGKFNAANTPIIGIYGTEDTIIKPAVIHALRDEWASTPLKAEHKLVMINGAKHDFIMDKADEATRVQVGRAWTEALAFVETYIQPPKLDRPKIY